MELSGRSNFHRKKKCTQQKDQILTFHLILLHNLLIKTQQISEKQELSRTFRADFILYFMYLHGKVSSFKINLNK